MKCSECHAAYMKGYRAGKRYAGRLLLYITTRRLFNRKVPRRRRRR